MHERHEICSGDHARQFVLKLLHRNRRALLQVNFCMLYILLCFTCFVNQLWEKHTVLSICMVHSWNICPNVTCRSVYYLSLLYSFWSQLLTCCILISNIQRESRGYSARIKRLSRQQPFQRERNSQGNRTDNSWCISISSWCLAHERRKTRNFFQVVYTEEVM